DLVRQVREPDEKKLRKGDVGPEANEGQEELAQAVVVRGPQEAFQVSVRIERVDDDDEGGNRGDEAACEVVDAEDGRGPVGLEGHEPIEGREGEGKCNGGQAPGAELSLLDGEVETACFVLPPRPGPEEVRNGYPNRKVDDRPRDEK